MKTLQDNFKFEDPNENMYEMNWVTNVKNTGKMYNFQMKIFFNSYNYF